MRKLFLSLILCGCALAQSSQRGGVGNIGGVVNIGSVPPPPAACSGYAFSVPIVLAKAQTSDQTNYPVHVWVRDPRLATVANGGNVQNTATNSIGRTVPADFIFVDNTGITGVVYKKESVAYDPGAGEYEGFVQIPTYHSASNDTVYLCANNASVTTSQDDLSFWGTLNYQAVFHFPNGSTLDRLNSVNGVAAPINKYGSTGDPIAVFQPGNGGSMFLGNYSGNGQNNLDLADSAGLRPSSNLTLEAEIFPDSNGNPRPIFTKPYFASSWSSPYFAYRMWLGNRQVGFAITSLGVGYCACSTTVAPFMSWSHVSGTYDGSTVRSYLNGSSVATASHSGSIDYNGVTPDVAIGTEMVGVLAGAGDEFYQGALKEARISNDTKTAAWLANDAATINPYQSNTSAQWVSFPKPSILQWSSCATPDLTSPAVCAMPFNTTAGADTITTAAGDTAAIAMEVRGATLTGAVSAATGQQLQPYTLSATSPGSNNFLLCGTSLDGSAWSNSVSPSSYKLMYSPQSQSSSHAAQVGIAYGLVGSGSHGCSFSGFLAFNGGRGGTLDIFNYSATGDVILVAMTILNPTSGCPSVPTDTLGLTYSLLNSNLYTGTLNTYWMCIYGATITP